MGIVNKPYTISLGGNLAIKWPLWWLNFLRTVPNFPAFLPPFALGYYTRNALRPYNAKLVEPKTHSPYLRFDSEEDATFFILKWS